MKKDWTETIRDRLAESEVTPPEGLWADISSSLDAGGPMARPRHRMSAWRWVAAAACLAATVVCGVWIFDTPRSIQTDTLAFVDGEGAEVDGRHSLDDRGEDAPPPSTMLTDRDGDSPTSKQTVDGNPDDAGWKPALLDGRDEDTPPSSTTLMDRDEDGLTSKQTADDSPDDAGWKPALLDGRGEETPPSSTTLMGTRENGHRAEAAPQHQHKQLRERLSVSLYAANPDLPNIGFGKGDVCKDIFAQSPEDPNEDFTTPGIPSGTPTDTPSDQNPPQARPKTEAHHHQPIRYGLSVRVPLSQRMSIGTGVIYSRLTSDITVRGDQYMLPHKIDQTLHYVGVPLSVDYALMSRHPASLYLTGGVMAERCVYGEAKRDISTTTERVSEHGLQLSVFAGAGLQINLSDHVALYAEPLATYYIDNHSPLTSIYKDRPLNIDLRLGLRYTFR